MDAPRTVTTKPRQDLLWALRGMLEDADEAVVASAFIDTRGVHLLGKELERLGSSSRLLATSVFGGDRTHAAMTVASGWGTHCRLYNPSRGTFHPKVVVAKAVDGHRALVGSANITAGLLANVEAGVILSGEQAEDVAQLVEAWWSDPQAVDWQPPVTPAIDRFEEPLWSLIEHQVQPGDVLHTLSDRKPNRIVESTPAGLWVETERSLKAGGPQLVEPWMVEVAWAALTTDGSLTNRHLLEDLRVHRSSFVCALLAALPGVEVTSRRPIILTMRASAPPIPSRNEIAAESGPPYELD